MRNFVVLLLVGALLLAGCGRVESLDEVAETPQSYNSAQATRDALGFTPVPTPPPTAAPLDDPTDPLTIVLGGQYSNGGYWTWTDISNLLGVYAEYGAFVTVTAGDADYTGVPLEYLFDYARLNERALSTVFFTRDGRSLTIPTAELVRCDDCLIAETDGGLSLVFPEWPMPVIGPLVRIETR